MSHEKTLDLKARAVIIDTDGNVYGDWHGGGNSAAIIIHLIFHKDRYESRVDVRIGHREMMNGGQQAGEVENRFARIYADQIMDLREWLIDPNVKITDPDLSFVEMLSNLNKPAETSTAPFRQLFKMKFEEGVDRLLKEKRLWLVKLKRTSRGDGSIDYKRHGEGLFATMKEYGQQTADMRMIESIFRLQTDFYFVVKGDRFDETIGYWGRHCKEAIPHTKITEKLFPNHVHQHYLRQGDHPDPSDLKGEFPPRCESVFRNVQEYNLVVGWGAIVDHMIEREINGNGEMFKGRIQVYSIAIVDSERAKAAAPKRSGMDRSYLAIFSTTPNERNTDESDSDEEVLGILDAQDDNETVTTAPDRFKTGARFGVRFHSPSSNEHCPVDPSQDIWSATVVSPASFCPLDCWTVILRRPSSESPGAGQPRVITIPRGKVDFTVDNVNAETWCGIKYQMYLSETTYDRFLTANIDLTCRSVNRDMMHTLLGTNPSMLPTVNALDGIPQAHLNRVLNSLSVSDDVERLIQNVKALHGRLYTVEGPAGTGKSHAMLALAMIDLGGEAFKYPVHSEHVPPGEWCPLFTKCQKLSRENTGRLNVNLYDEKANRQVLLIAATNAVADSLTIKATAMHRMIFPTSQPRIIRVHAANTERQVVEKGWLAKDMKSAGNEVDDMDTIIQSLIDVGEHVNELMTHYALVYPETVSS